MPGAPRKNKVGPNGDASRSRVAEQALQLIRLSVLWSKNTRRSTILRSINIYPPAASRNGLWLVVGKGWDQGYRVVAFHRSTDFLVAVLGFLSKVADQSIEWHPDKFQEE